MGVALLVAGPALGAERPRVVSLESAELSAYTSVVAAFSATARVELIEINLEKEPDAVKKIAESPPALVLALGPAAANAAKKGLQNVPIVFCMVPYHEKYALEAPNVTGIALTNDLEVELAALRAVAPGAKRVGVVFDPRYSSPTGVVPIPAEGATAIDHALKAAKDNVDAILLVADKTVGSAAVIRKILAFAEQEKLPAMAFSPAQVKEGALLSLAPSHTAIGEQAGRLAGRIIREKVDPGALAIAPPEGLEVTFSLGAARRLGLGADPAYGLLQFAAQRGYTVHAVQ